MEGLRTPDDRFADLPGWPFAPRYAEVDGLRIQPHTIIRGAGHFLQEDRGEALARVVVDWMRGLGVAPGADVADSAR